MFKKTETKPAPVVRSLADAEPTYAAAKDLILKLKASLSALDDEENQIRYTLANAPPKAEVTGRIAALLGDAVPDGAPVGANARLTAIAAERSDLRSAVDIAQERLAQARFAASRVIAAEVAPVYAERVQALARALVSAHAAQVQLLDLIADLNREDVVWTGAMPPMQADIVFGHLGGTLAVWLKDAANSGFIKTSDIPSELRV